MSREAVTAAVTDMAADTLLDDPSEAAISALLDAGTQLTEAQLRAALGTADGWPEVDYAAGVATASGYSGLL